MIREPQDTETDDQLESTIPIVNVDRAFAGRARTHTTLPGKTPRGFGPQGHITLEPAAQPPPESPKANSLTQWSYRAVHGGGRRSFFASKLKPNALDAPAVYLVLIFLSGSSFPGSSTDISADRRFRRAHDGRTTKFVFPHSRTTHVQTR